MIKSITINRSRLLPRVYFDGIYYDTLRVSQACNVLPNQVRAILKNEDKAEYIINCWLRKAALNINSMCKTFRYKNQYMWTALVLRKCPDLSLGTVSDRIREWEKTGDYKKLFGPRKKRGPKPGTILGPRDYPKNRKRPVSKVNTPGRKTVQSLDSLGSWEKNNL